MDNDQYHFGNNDTSEQNETIISGSTSRQCPKSHKPNSKISTEGVQYGWWSLVVSVLSFPIVSVNLHPFPRVLHSEIRYPGKLVILQFRLGFLVRLVAR
jgi:hypothetical protein